MRRNPERKASPLAYQARIKAWDARAKWLATRQRNREAAIERLLTRQLTPGQRLSWFRRWILVFGSEGAAFWLSPDVTIEFTQGDTFAWCIHGHLGRNIESMLAIKMLIETDERRFRLVAHCEGAVSEADEDYLEYELVLHLIWYLELGRVMTRSDAKRAVANYTAGRFPPDMKGQLDESSTGALAGL